MKLLPKIGGVILALFGLVAQYKGLSLSVDLAAQTIVIAPGCMATHKIKSAQLPLRFNLPEARKNSLLKGLDEIGETLEHAKRIQAFEADYKAKNPWLFSTS